MIIQIGEYATKVPQKDLEDKIVEIDFNGELMVQIERVTEETEDEYATWVIRNAMDGYGNNCFEEFRDEEVSVLPY